MNFIELKKTSGFQYDGIFVRPTYVTITKAMKDRIGEEPISIFFDVAEKAVAIGHGGENTRAFSGSQKLQITARLVQEMPRGRYYFSEEKEGLVICVYKP